MWLLYGANGTTGRILLRYWAEQRTAIDLPPPILAGRQESAIAALAKTYGLSYRTFGLETLLNQDFSGIRLIVNFAGPYEDTQAPWLRVCEAQGIAYLDISGEWRSLEALYENASRYAASGLVVITAAGFDTVAGEAALWAYRKKYPASKRLRLGIYAEGGFSAGTARSAFRMLPHGFWAYEAGQLIPSRNPLKLTLPQGSERVFWPATLAELKTFPAWQTIDRLETYVAVPPRYGRWTPLLERILLIAPIAGLMDHLLASQRLRLAGEMDLSARSYLFVEGEESQERLWIETEQAYLFTARSVLEVVRLYFQEGSWSGVGSAFHRYAEWLWERLSFQTGWWPV